MATFSFKSLRQQQQHFLSLTPSKSSSKHLNSNTHHFLSHAFTLKHKLHQEISSLFITKASISGKLEPQIADKQHENATQVIDSDKKLNSGLSPLRSREERVKKKSDFNSLMEEKMERQYRRRDSDVVEPRRKREMGSGVSSLRSKDDEKVEIKPKRSRGVIRGKKMGNKSDVNEEKYPKKKKLDMVEVQFRIQLDQCSKRGDFSTAIALYDSVQKQGNLELGQYHYTVLLYLCSSAAVGVVRPMKSGNDSRTFSIMSAGDEGMSEEEDGAVRLDDNVKRIARMKGFEIYEKMCAEKIPLNEAALTSVARLAMSIGDGEMALQMVNKMKELGINPRLRSYGPALFTFCSKGDVEKAFKVEEHMLENGVYPEGPELEALLKVSVETGTADKVYYVLHKLRTCVRKVSASTADLIEKWFGSKAASRVGKRKWDQALILEAVKNGGGGWHGQGWLGKGNWAVKRTYIGADGYCEGCGEKLVTIDLDPTETENFAKCVASIAMKREKTQAFRDSKYEKKWLDYYGPFEAVVDGANVGLLTQKSFSVSKVNAIVNGIRQRLPSKKLPLIIVHHKRIEGGKMEEPANKKIIEKWKNADAIFATPTGSNDDWYWLYAAIKFKCLLVTNDEMRDHIFQLLGNDFFPRWKERHQVHFDFSEWGPEFEMPPPCSVVIQESECGHWHIPVASEQDSERDRTWLCATRMHVENQDFPKRHEDAHLPNTMKSKSVTSKTMKQPSSDHGEGATKHENTQPLLQKKPTGTLEIFYQLHYYQIQTIKPLFLTLRRPRNLVAARLTSKFEWHLFRIANSKKKYCRKLL